ncbi:hypothetical protein [Thiohalorhabdus methylotrophus]|uniref:Uncharacterized protein n=1 Tax=Thiohalorhabdus methylotrophus TaxID=3242694 RepID=A0ABV4TQQ9_9GAMM
MAWLDKLRPGDAGLVKLLVLGMKRFMAASPRFSSQPSSRRPGSDRGPGRGAVRQGPAEPDCLGVDQRAHRR